MPQAFSLNIQHTLSSYWNRLHLFAVEDTSNTLANNSLILVGSSTASWDLRKNVVCGKHTSRPASPAKVNVRVGHQVVENIANGSQARRIVGATGLGEDGLTAVGAQPRGELGETGNVAAGGDTGGGGTWIWLLISCTNIRFRKERLPEPSLSEYWWTSNTKLVLLPSRLVTLLRAAAEPSSTNEVAWVCLRRIVSG